MTRAVATDALTKDYDAGFWHKRPRRALDHLTLEVAQGEVFGYLGPNGAGKTTTLKLLMQLVHPTAGRADILLDVTTSLDPHFTIAYRFGAMFLAEPIPNGPGRPDLAVALLKKGVAAQPRKWQYLQDLGFVHYWWLHDYAAAASWFMRASQVSGSPWWLRPLAATMVAQGGDRASSRLLWQEIRSTADQQWLRSEADRRLAQLAALDELDRLREVVRRFAARERRESLSWNALVRAGVLPEPPTDPAGVPFLLDAISGRVDVSSASPLFPLPTEPPARPRS